jgi:glycosyltransferase involved in cell wall biosynthesis
MNIKKISIITVTFNCEKTIDETVLNVLSQNYSNIEYIVVDGESDDKTYDILLKYKSRFSYLIREKDMGIFDAMNKALKYASGDYAIFINSGDSFVNNHVISDIFSKYDGDDDLIYGDDYVLDRYGYLLRKAKDIYSSNPSKKDLVFKSQGFCHQALFTKLSILKQLGFDLKYPLGADYDTTAKVFSQGNHKILYVGFPIAVFDNRYGGASHNRVKSVLLERAQMFDYPLNYSFYFKANLMQIKDFIKIKLAPLFYKRLMNKRVQSI